MHLKNVFMLYLIINVNMSGLKNKLRNYWKILVNR